MRRAKQTVVAGLLVLTSLMTTPLAGPETALAADATVNACTESSFEAALSAVQNSGGGTVTFNCSGVITFDHSSKTISTDVTILGNGGVIFDGNGRLSTRLFWVSSGAELTLVGVTLRNGSANTVGGAIRNFGTLNVSASTFSDNSADGSGGAIDNFGTATVTASVFSGNTAGEGGGSILNLGTLTVRDSTFSENSATEGGGAISNTSGKLIVTDSIFSSNSAVSDGGAIDSGAKNAATIKGSTFSNNSANRGGAIFHARDVAIATSTFSSNSAVTDGGAIYNLGSTATITDSTFNENRAGSDGGAISNVGPLETTANVTASTFSGNGAGSLGGAIHSIATATVKASTFSDNSANQGGAISNSGFATITSSIMASNQPGFSCAGTITSAGFNLSDDTSCQLTGAGDHEGGNVTIDLGELDDNGGPTATMFPGVNSDAIDAADCAVSSPQDQRGATRPTVSGPANVPSCDIGAVEVEGSVPDLPITPVQIFAVSSPGGAEGASVTVFVLAAGPDNDNLSYAFDCDDDGDYETSGTESGASGSATVAFGACTFSDNGSYTVSVQICDGGDASNCDMDSTNVDVNNVAPLVDAGNNVPIREGTSLSGSGSFSDLGADTWTATVDYGDGSGVQLLALNGNSFTLDHLYTDGDNDPYTVTICVADDDGGVGCASFEVSVWRGSELVGILVDPIAQSELSESIKTPLIGRLVEIGLSIDAGEIATACTQLQEFGTFVEQQAGEALPHGAVDFIIERVDIIFTFIGCTTIELDPTITAVTNDGPVDEGSPATIAIIATGGSGPLSYAFDCDNDGSYETVGAGNQGQCTYADDDSYTVGVKVTDDAGNSATDSTTVTVSNVAPLVDAGADALIDEGALFSRDGSFTDPGADAWTATVDYGDGEGVEPLALDGDSFDLGHVYVAADDGPFTVTVCVMDDEGSEGCDSFAVTVLSAVDQIASLATTIANMHLHHGLSTSLLSKLAKTEASIEAGKIATACNQLGAFSNQVGAQAGKKLTQAEADQLLTDADRIRLTLGCH